MIEDAQQICGWWVPEGDPYFGPLIRKTAGQIDTDVIVAALNHVTERGRAIDVGAHIGTWTRPLAGCFEEVVAIEPDDRDVPVPPHEHRGNRQRLRNPRRRRLRSGPSDCDQRRLQ